MAAPTTEFSSYPTDIPGLVVFDVTSVGDARGWFQEKYQKAKLVAAGLPEDFTVVQTNVSFNQKKGVIRGFHAEPWDKYLSVIVGQVFCAFVDLRKGDSFGKVYTATLDNNKAIYLPRGVGNAFQTLTDNTYYIYSVTDHWSQENYDKYMFVNLADADIGISWPIPLDQSVMSDRDRNHPPLSEVKPMEI